MVEGFVGVVVVVMVVTGAIGASIGSSKKAGAAGGFLLGIFLGPIGVLVAALSGEPSLIDRLESQPSEAGWHPDPLGRFDARWYNGQRWTQHVGRVEADGTRRTLEDPV